MDDKIRRHLVIILPQGDIVYRCLVVTIRWQVTRTRPSSGFGQQGKVKWTMELPPNWPLTEQKGHLDPLVVR